MVILVTSAADSGTGSLRAAIAAAQPGDTIGFDPSLSDRTITLTSDQLVIDKNLTIDGTSAIGLTLSGNNSSRIFDIPTASTVTLRNLAIANGRAAGAGEAGNGGGIRTAGNTVLLVDNIDFTNNIATGEGGGAIFAGFRHQTTIVNSRFEGNDGTPGNSERGGGAIATSSEGNLIVQGSRFTNNRGINGGAINNLLGNLTIENSTFLNNDSTPGSSNQMTRGYGGAVYVDGASASTSDAVGGTIRITGSEFEGNRGAGQGGGLFLFVYPPDSVVVENSSIVNNTVVRNGLGDALGGGLRHGNGTLTLRNTTIANNTAESQGGGFWVGETSPVTIVNSTFSGNRAQSPDGGDGLGGAMALANGNAPTQMIDTTIANNIAGFQGGGFWGGGPSTTLTNTIVAYNRGINGFNAKHHTGTTFSDGGGNFQSNELNPNDLKVTPNATTVDPQLNPLNNNGGGLLTHALKPGSPAVNAGVASGVSTDGRGAARSDGAIDSGAFEFGAIVLTVFTPTDDLVALGADSSFANALTGDDTVTAGAGDDTILGGAGSDVLSGNEGSDRLFGNTENDVIYGNQNDDSISAGRGNDSLYGGADRDALFGNRDEDLLVAGMGSDSLYGGRGNDVLWGEDGDDWLSGDLGNDSLTGGAGLDRFIVAENAGFDRILDFTDGQDLLGLAGGLTFAQLTIAQITNATTISVSQTGKVLVQLDGVNASAIGIEDFG